MLRKIFCITVFALLLQMGSAVAGSTGSENLKKSRSQDSAPECFEGVSRAVFTINHTLDKVMNLL